MSAAKKHNNGDQIACPYCGRKGTVALSHDDLSVVHLVEFRDIPTANGGTVRAAVLVDGCSRFGKMGVSVLHVVASQPAPEDEEFTG